MNLLQPDEPNSESLLVELKNANATGVQSNVQSAINRIASKYKEMYSRDESKQYHSIDLWTHSEFLSNKKYHNVVDALQMFKDDELIAKPGSEFKYSTHGYTLLSAVLERSAKQSYIDQAQKLFKDLQMNHSGIDSNQSIISHRSRYYYRDIEHRLRNTPQVDNSCKWAGGGLISNVTDLLKFANAMLYSYQRAMNPAKAEGAVALLDEETIRTFWKGEVEVKKGRLYALGWYRINKNDPYGGWEHLSPDVDIYLHTGSACGASSVLLIKPSDLHSEGLGTCVAILTNLHECGELTQLAIDLINIFENNEDRLHAA